MGAGPTTKPVVLCHNMPTASALQLSLCQTHGEAMESKTPGLQSSKLPSPSYPKTT